MRKRRVWTRADEEARDREDEKAMGCLADGAGCFGLGCLGQTAPVLLVAGLMFFR